MKANVRVVSVKTPPPPGSGENPAEFVQFVGISGSGDLSLGGNPSGWSNDLIMEIGFSNPALVGSFKVGDEFQVEIVAVAK